MPAAIAAPISASRPRDLVGQDLVERWLAKLEAVVDYVVIKY